MVNQAGQSFKTSISDHTNAKGVVKGLIVSYIITLPTFAIFALILTYSNYPEKMISPVVVVATLVSVVVAGSTATRNVKSKGWLNGGIVGFVYMLILYLISSIAYRDFSVNVDMIVMMAIGLLAGAIGGIIGINYKKSSRVKSRR